LREVGMTGGTDQQAIDFGAGFPGVIAPQPGPAAIAQAHGFETFVVGGLRHGTPLATTAADGEADNIAAGALFVDPQLAAAGGRAFVDERVPVDFANVALGTGANKADRDDGMGCAVLVNVFNVSSVYYSSEVNSLISFFDIFSDGLRGWCV